MSVTTTSDVQHPERAWEQLRGLPRFEPLSLRRARAEGWLEGLTEGSHHAARWLTNPIQHTPEEGEE